MERLTVQSGRCTGVTLAEAILLRERKLVDPERTDVSLRRRIASEDAALCGDWKGSSTSPVGRLLQVATAEELGGRLKLKTSADLNVPEVKGRADKIYSDIGGYNGIKAYVRAKWETSQYLLDKAGIKTLNLYRGIAEDKEKYDKQHRAFRLTLYCGRHFPAHQEYETKVGKFNFMPTLHVERNGAASTTTDIHVANGWAEGRQTQITLRAQVPRTAVVSVPAYGINVHSEHEVVVAGTGWHGWDAWAGKAPPLDYLPLQKAA